MNVSEALISMVHGFSPSDEGVIFRSYFFTTSSSQIVQCRGVFVKPTNAKKAQVFLLVLLQIRQYPVCILKCFFFVGVQRYQTCQMEERVNV